MKKKKSLNKILSVFQKTIADLDQLCEQNFKELDHIDCTMQGLRSKRHELSLERSMALETREKLAELIGGA
jgi:hypothetical protein